MNIRDVASQYFETFDSVKEWIAVEYDSYFAPYFQDVVNLNQRMKSSSYPITNQELEQILVQLPLKLFEVSEKLNELKLQSSVLKIEIKKKEYQVANNSDGTSVSQRQAEGAASVLDDKILETSMISLVHRVEQQIDLAKELIMGAKKIWDGRRSTDASNPISDVNIVDYRSTGSPSPSVVRDNVITSDMKYIK